MKISRLQLPFVLHANANDFGTQLISIQCIDQRLETKLSHENSSQRLLIVHVLTIKVTTRLQDTAGSITVCLGDCTVIK